MTCACVCACVCVMYIYTYYICTYIYVMYTHTHTHANFTLSLSLSLSLSFLLSLYDYAGVTVASWRRASTFSGREGYQRQPPGNLRAGQAQRQPRSPRNSVPLERFLRCSLARTTLEDGSSGMICCLQ